MKFTYMRYTLFWLLVSFMMGSCTVNKDLLFKTPKGYEYIDLPEEIGPSAKLAPNNFVTMNFFTGNGYMLVEMGLGSAMLGGSQQMQGGQQGMMMMMQGGGMRYLIDRDGTAKLPVIGRIKLAGLSIRDAETFLEEIYAQYYNEPYVVLNVQNNRAIVMPGAGGTAQVITLINNNTTLLEALAMVGGVNERGNASEIKLIRQNDQTTEREMFRIDLSTVDGMQMADMIVQPNDIIYVEPLPLIARELVQEFTPVITLISTTVLILAIFNLN
jgi:polysaccharide export outer membrane protein